MTFESTPETVATHPWMIYAGLVVGVLLLVSGAAPRFFGSLGQTWHDWLMRRRTAAIEADDADIIDLRRERDYLAGVAAERLRELRARDVLIREHAPWDWERYEAAIRAGHAVTHPPPLVPHIPPPTEPLGPESVSRLRRRPYLRRSTPMSDQPSIPDEHKDEPDLYVEQESPDLEVSDDDEAVEYENVPTSDLPEVLPPSDDDDEDAVLDDEVN